MLWRKKRFSKEKERGSYTVWLKEVFFDKLFFEVKLRRGKKVIGKLRKDCLGKRKRLYKSFEVGIMIGFEVGIILGLRKNKEVITIGM